MRRIDSPFSAVVMLGIAMLSGCASHNNLSTANSQVSFGVKAARMDLWREARFRFERAVQLDPNDAMAHNNLAVAYEGSGDFDRARLEYVRALQIDKSNQYIQKNYSRFMEFYGRSKKREAVPAAAGKPAAAPPAPATPATPPSQPAGPTIPPPPTGATSAESPQPGAPTPPPPGGAA